MEARGIEPLTRPCKGRVFPLAPRPREQTEGRAPDAAAYAAVASAARVRAATAAAVAALMSTVSSTSGA
jgi:hypothetical protein